MNTIFSWIYKIYLRISAIIRVAYVAKQIKCFTPPPPLFWERYT